MKYYIIAGEASGDLHGSNLIKELYKKDAAATIRCWGGDLMQSTGATLVKHYKSLAFMGFTEVVINLRTILKNIAFCKRDILSFQPDILILIDYPGFNLRIADWAHKITVQSSQLAAKIAFYISPQVWAWKESRVPKMKKNIDLMLVILPFEKEYYQNKWNWNVEYVGHPLVQIIDNFQQQPHKNLLPARNIIALLPGSRRQEISIKLPVMLHASKAFPDYEFVVAKAPSIPDEFYQSLMKDYSNVSSVTNQTYTLLSQSQAALVTSGTATLETALFRVPEVVCYKGSNISYQIAKRLIKVKFISLVNLIMDKMIVKELIQHDLTTENLVKELQDILYNSERRNRMNEDYTQLHQLLSKGGDASARAAERIINL